MYGRRCQDCSSQDRETLPHCGWRGGRHHARDPITKECDCSAGEDLLVDLELDLTSTATERYDIATWLSYEGADFAHIGNDCTVASYNVEALENIDILTRPVGKCDDNCGDVYGVSSPHSADVCGLPLKCLDASATSGGTVAVGACNTWKQNVKGEACDQADRSTLLPGAPSKCKCECLHFPIDIRCGLSAMCNLSPATHECVAVDGEPPTHSNVADVFAVTSDPDNTCDHEMTLASSDNGGAGCVADPHVITRSYELDDGNAWTDPVDPCEEAWTCVDAANPSLADPVAHGPHQCPKDVPTAQTLGAADDCDESPDANCLGETESPPNEDCTFALTRSWEAKDSCGNTDAKTLDIQVDMTAAPTFTNCPQHKTVNICKDTCIPDASPTATDRCGNPATVSCNDCAWVAEGVLSRSWTATDDCDNEATCTQLVTFNMACT